ncbi:hypothetical protein [Priestia megaterium]|uniref:Uncharacterized protein n=1 Tax=Priestia megaterium TaxID=1404 RepID=A0A6M6E8Z5_PRIMG|nr:hypothetical protein [Priestia megaterium]QJX80065.1 hypothetical protein FDZ14_28630 [Priestia megaterium]
MISSFLKWVSGIGEAFLGIPLYGGLFVFSLGWTPLIAMLVLHIVTLIFSSKENTRYYGSILGIVTSLLAWIPILGMFLHIISGFLLIWDAYKSSKKKALV